MLGYLTLFDLACCIEIIVYIFDQKRLKAGLYGHLWDDIVYMLEKMYYSSFREKVYFL